MPNNCFPNSSPSYAPFMFGGHRPGARSAALSQTNLMGPFGGRQDTVRDCLSWTNSLPMELQGNSNYSWGGNSGQSSAPSYTYTMPVQPQAMSSTNRPAPPAPVAFMSIPGQGGKGDIQPISIPIQVGNSGSKMGPLPAMEPLVINAALPTSGNGVAEPFTFQISPEQYFGGGRR